MRYWQLWI